ncbi:MAG TPA: ATP-binding cassette domain-containing protein, partial [Acidobacteriota bacterium]|nr:ATP-binding cassette domain-containing protein [Acidobacteriota bacterium]
MTEAKHSLQGVEVRLVGISKRAGKRMLVDTASLTVRAGSIVALFGPSGCGKTTTLRMIAGLDVPDSGEIWIGTERAAADGCNLLSPRRRAI